MKTLSTGDVVEDHIVEPTTTMKCTDYGPSPGCGHLMDLHEVNQKTNVWRCAVFVHGKRCRCRF